jgi:hypothetical protein
MIRAGIPEQIAEMNAQAFGLTADGDAEWVTQDVPSLLGRPARSFEQFTADYAAAFSSSRHRTPWSRRRQAGRRRSYQSRIGVATNNP